MDISPKQVLDLASLAAPCYLKFCVKGVGANLTATLAAN